MCWIRLSAFLVPFLKRRSGPILDGLVRFGPNLSGLEANWCARITRPAFGRKQPAGYQFLTFRCNCILPQTAQIILCKTSPDWVWFWLTVSGSGQMDPVRKQASVQKSSGPLLASASKPIQIGSSMFTGKAKNELPVAHSGHRLKGRAVCEFDAATDTCSASSECRCIALGLHCTIVFSACFIIWLLYLLSVECSAASHSFALF